MAADRIFSPCKAGDGVVPELLELLGTLSPAQQKAIMGIMSQGADGRQKKRSRPQQPAQPAEPLSDSRFQSKEQDSPTVRAATRTNVGVGDVQAQVDSGTPAPHIHRDTSGTYRVAFHYSPEVRRKTVDWILTECGNAYTNPVMRMWASGSQDWEITLLKYPVFLKFREIV